MRNYGLKDLVRAEGFDSVFEMMEEYAIDSVCPAICVDCGYTTFMEPDQDSGYCEDCGSNRVKSALILGGMI